MTRMIERWFPCEEVSASSQSGWGTGNRESALFTWFAKRPIAQARAAVLCSLLPWPDEPREQRRLQDVVRSALKDEDAGQDAVRLLRDAFERQPTVLDPFSGRGMIPLEGVRLGALARGVDYSPVAALAGTLLADYPFRSWESEPELPLPDYHLNPLADRLTQDIEFVSAYIGNEYASQMFEFYPPVDGVQPWGYVWAVSIPCQHCGRWFPLVGSLALRKPHRPSGVVGISYKLVIDGDDVVAEVHTGPPTSQPTLVRRGAKRGRIGICPFCEGAHDQALIRRIMRDGHRRDTLLLAADPDAKDGKRFRRPTADEQDAAVRAEEALRHEPPFGPVPAVPDEPTPPGLPVLPSVYGYSSYGDLCCARQTLGYVRLARIVENLGRELADGGVSDDYRKCLTGYAASVIVRKLRRSTRGATLEVYNDGRPTGVKDIFVNESSIAFNFDYVEVGLGDGAGSWRSVATRTTAALRGLRQAREATPARIGRGNAAELPYPDQFVDAVVTDPPYDSMIYYSDTSDLFFVWLKRALHASHPELASTAASDGLQEKDHEAIVREHKTLPGEHRTRAHYDRMMNQAFSEARRVVSEDGVVTIVFGHGEPEVWHRLLTAITQSGLVLTGSWPAQTEKGGKAGTANIVTTLTLACRKAASSRRSGRVSEIDAEVRQEIADRIPLWDSAGLALTDQLMASAGPAMEVVGRYSEVLDKTGQPVDLDRYLPLARRFVEEAADIKVDTLPLETFDQRTRFALFWVRLYGRGIAAASEARWQRLASDLSDDDTAGLLVKDGKGVRFAFSSETTSTAAVESPVIDVALAVAAAGKSVAAVADVLSILARVEDPFLWAAMGELSRLVPEADPDGDVWTWVVRNRSAITGASRNVEAAKAREEHEREAASRQATLFGGED